MASRCSLYKECCTTHYQELGAGQTARPSTTPSMLSSWETIHSQAKLRTAAPTHKTTLQPYTAEPHKTGAQVRKNKEEESGAWGRNLTEAAGCDAAWEAVIKGKGTNSPEIELATCCSCWSALRVKLHYAIGFQSGFVLLSASVTNGLSSGWWAVQGNCASP